MRFTLFFLVLAAAGVLVAASFLFDAGTVAMMGLTLGIVSGFGALPIYFGVLARRGRSSRRTRGDLADIHEAEILRREDGWTPLPDPPPAPLPSPPASQTQDDPPL